ncbi:MAG TPA: hypothetical protein VM223_17515, partial [Planctomycetota bacterium]|nr:hypothetical protein [Planctomycetota bacterium]
RIVYTLVPAADLSLNSLHVEIRMPEPALAGGTWSAGGKNGSFPAASTGTGLFNEQIKAFTIGFPSGEAIDVTLDEPVRVLLQDNRRWGPTFSARIGPQGDAAPFKKGEAITISLVLRAKGGLLVEFDKPVMIEAGPDWIPLKLELDVAPGSALDFSTQGFCDAPAGKHGWLIARPDGQFAFEKTPDVPRRFYGVNFCFSSLYLSHEQADRLADRLVRLGYNAVRVHHYEGELVQGQPNSLTFNPAKLDQLDYLMAAFIKRGIYITTDLFVSRPVTPRELGLDGPATRGTSYEFKVLVPVMDKAWENWKAFAKAFLWHVNPYTGRSYAQEPGLAWLSMINEGNLGNYWGAIREIPEWSTAWNTWLAGRYADRAALAAEWGTDLQADEDPAKGTVKLPSDAYADTPRARDGVAFLSATEAATFARMRDFLRNDLGCRALLTNMNGWSNRATDQAARNLFDYGDDHFYVDHPQFLQTPWQLPSRCRNASPVAAGAADGRHNGFVRLIDKPFAISEYNYSAPGRYRGVGGILTGAMAAIQGWGAVWRFAYSHNRDNLFRPSKMNYFDMAADPLGQAAERAAICLFLRGDMQPAPHSVVITVDASQLPQPEAKVPRVSPPWDWAAWITRVGMQVVDARHPASGSLVLPLDLGNPGTALAARPNPYLLDDPTMLARLRDAGMLAPGNPTDPAKNVLRSETGEITIDAPRNVMILDTPRTAGGFIPAGQDITTAAGVAVAATSTDASVWVSSLDGQPIASSRHMLITHLTDVQNSRVKYAERDMRTLLDWGGLPHLVRAGRAAVSLKSQHADKLTVWALSTSGRRLSTVPAKVEAGKLTFTADVAAFAGEHGAVLCYEVVAE